MVAKTAARCYGRVMKKPTSILAETQPPSSPSSAQPSPWPVEIRLKSDKKHLDLLFDDGTSYTLTAEYLRISSPSAEVRGHGLGQNRKIVFSKEAVTIRDLEPLGNYALRLIFSDGHDTGFYTWAYLHLLAIEKPQRWAAYLLELKEKGLA
jgi:DUF971 family protein